MGGTLAPLALAQVLQTWRDSTCQSVTLNAAVTAQWVMSELPTLANAAACACHSAAPTRTTRNDRSVTLGLLVRICASSVLASRANETSTPNASQLERSFSRSAQRSTSIPPKTVASRNATSQLNKLSAVAL